MSSNPLNPAGSDPIINFKFGGLEWILISVIDPIAQQVAFSKEGWVYSSLLGVSSYQF